MNLFNLLWNLRLFMNLFFFSFRTFFENQSKGLKRRGNAWAGHNKVQSLGKLNPSSSCIQPYQRKRLPTATVTSFGATSLENDTGRQQPASDPSSEPGTCGGLPPQLPGVSGESVTQLPAVPDVSRPTHLSGNIRGASCRGLTISAQKASSVYQPETTQPQSYVGSVNAFRTVFDTSGYRGQTGTSVKANHLPTTSQVLTPYKRKRPVWCCAWIFVLHFFILFTNEIE